jgi:type I restriction enzyme R subunit
VVKYTDYTGEKVRTLYPSAAKLREKWADPIQRSEIIEALADRGIDFEQLAEVTGQADADPFDLLCHVAYSAPLRTRRERATSLKREQKAFLEQYGPEAKTVLDELLEKYAEHGVAQFKLPDILKVPPISNYGNVIEIAQYFGGPEKLNDAVNRLQALLYAA